MMMNNDNMQIATTILEQLGGRKAQVMIGMRDMVASPDGLSFGWKVRGARNRATKCVVTLTPDDFYTVRFYRASRPANVHLVSEHEGLFWDQLVELFEGETGLYLRL